MTDSELLLLEDRSFVEQAYLVVLGRQADPSGLRSYLERCQRGISKEQILSELRASSEGRRHAQVHGLPDSPQRAAAPPRPPAWTEPTPTLRTLLRLPDPTFIEHAYRLTLGRSADVSGRANYLQELQRGVSRLDVLHELLSSAEGLRVNAPLPELRERLARRQALRLPGIRHALRAVRAMNRQLHLHAASAEARRFTSVPTPRSDAGEGRDPLLPLQRLPQGSRAPGNPGHPSAGDAGSCPHTTTAGRIKSAQAQRASLDMLATPMRNDETDPELLAAAPCELHAQRLVGPLLHGWSTIQGAPAACSLHFAGRLIARLVPDVERPELDATRGLQSPVVGFSAVVGGLLQFAAMSAACNDLRLVQQGEGGTELAIDLEQHLPEALTFAPMRALLRPLPREAGQIRSMRLTGPLDASIIFEAPAAAGGSDSTLLIDFYQEDTSQQAAQRLVRIARFAVEPGGHLQDLALRLKDPQAALLMVMTDTGRGLIASDCFPLPALFAERHLPLMEYHVTLESGKSAFGVVAKIARSFLDAAIHERTQASAAAPSADLKASTLPQRKSTTLVLYSRGSSNPPWQAVAERLAPLAADLVILQADGGVRLRDGTSLPWASFLAQNPSRHFLLHDAEADLRPDFWALVASQAFRLASEPAVVHWHAIWIDGLSRPQVVKAALLLDPVFADHTLLEARSLLVTRATLEHALRDRADCLTSGRLVLENALQFVAAEQVACLPVVMHTVRTPILPLQEQRFLNDHTPLPVHPGQAARAAAAPAGALAGTTGRGVSVIVNYRDSVADTLRCLESLARQELDGPIEVILVNNGSTPESVETVVGRARELLGSEQVTPMDYPHRFNHSTQCNVAAVGARHELLLMLSNDSVLLSPRAVARSAAVAAIPWVGTVGYRIVGNESTKRRLQSLGLALNPRRFLFSGGSPISTNLAPPFALDCTFEVVGNTFAAVMLRRDVYRHLDGLDSVAFPTSYNDVDFCFRATNAGYRHLVIGAEIVEHVGRGSREVDQDLPIDQRIIERAPRLDVLARVGFQQL